MKDEMTRAPLESYGVLREFVGGRHTINFLVRNPRGFMDSYTQLVQGFSGGRMESPSAIVQTMAPECHEDRPYHMWE